MRRPDAYFATVARGLETLAAEELRSLGAGAVKLQFAGVAFEGDLELLYRVNLWSRLIYRVLVPLAVLEAESAQTLYQGVHTLDWSPYLQPDQTFAVVCSGKNAQLNHSHFTALQVKNAIVDQQRRQFGRRSSINTEHPDLVVNAHIQDNQCQLSLDSSGFSLHRRGYRPALGQAPLKETLAAALLGLAEWRPHIPLYDPLCGSGSFLLEAGLQALHIAPGKFQRRFAFQSWPDYDPDLWQSLVQQAQAGELTQAPAPLWGSDENVETLEQAQSNAQAAGLGEQIYFFSESLNQIAPPTPEGYLICNPPYGKRIGNPEDLGDFYRQLGDIFKQRFKGWTAFVLSGNPELTKCIGLRPARRFPVFNGALPCTFLRYELY
jgi:putative N6-adenine-specific DNA methylase